MGQRKPHKPANKKVPDFTLSDILNAPQARMPGPRADGIGCLHCGGTRIIARGEIKVFRGVRMQPYHCHECGRDCYKEA